MLARFLKDTSASTGIEYGLIAGLIAVAIIAGMTGVGDGTEDMYDDLSKKVN